MTSAALAADCPPGRGLAPRLLGRAGRWRSPALRPNAAHAAGTTFAALAALGIAYALELNNPYSAAVTVLIVAHPVHGMVLAKSISRFAGTLAGCLVAILLMGLFAQIPELFMLGLGLWMGVCSFGSTLLRNFRSYGTVLAGYTVVLITMPGVDAPQTLFDLVTSRVCGRLHRYRLFGAGGRAADLTFRRARVAGQAARGAARPYRVCPPGAGGRRGRAHAAGAAKTGRRHRCPGCAGRIRRHRDRRGRATARHGADGAGGHVRAAGRRRLAA